MQKSYKSSGIIIFAPDQKLFILIRISSIGEFKMTLNTILQALVFFGSFGLFAVSGSAIASIIILTMFPNGTTDNGFLICLFGCYGGAILGVCIWLGVISNIMNYLF